MKKKKLKMKLSVASSDRKVVDVQESLVQGDFSLRKTVRSGMPANPTALAIDPVQKIVAIGSRTGAIRLLGRPGVEVHVEHEPEAEVQQLLFLINEGVMISMTDSSVLHLWTLRQKIPAVAQNLNFSREHVTCCHLPFKSEWLYIGTDAGNVYMANAHTFAMSMYSIHWNRAIGIAQKGKRPGPVVLLAEQPSNQNKLIIGFHSGLLALWDVHLKKAEMHFQYKSKFYCLSWLSDGSKFVCGHSSGELTFWSPKSEKPESTAIPHGKGDQSLVSISKIEYLSRAKGDPIIIFSGGVPKEDYQGAVTVFSNKSIRTLTFDSVLVDFAVLCEQPFPDETRDPHTLVVLLENRISFYDIASPGCPLRDCPYGLDLSLAPVTSTAYYTSVGEDLMTELTSATTRKRAKGRLVTSPLSGGTLGNPGPCVSNDIIITGHVDGSVRLWNSSSVNFHPLHEFDLSDVFVRGSDAAPDCLAVQQIYLCTLSHMLCVTTSSSNLVCCPFSRNNLTVERKAIDIVVSSGSFETKSPTASPPTFKNETAVLSAGFQPTLCCQLQSDSSSNLPQISSIAYASNLGLLAIGMTWGVSLIDVKQEKCLWTLPAFEIYKLANPSAAVSPGPNSPSHQRKESGVDDPDSKPSKWQMFLSRRRATGSNQSQSVRKKSSLRSVVALKKSLLPRNSDDNFGAVMESPPTSAEQNSIDGEECMDAVETVRFATTYGQKEIPSINDSLWIGTSGGNVACVVIQVPLGADRSKDSVMLLPTGSLFSLKDPVLFVTILDHLGSILPPSKQSLLPAKAVPTSADPTTSSKFRQPPTQHFAVFCTERQIKVYILPAKSHSYMKIDAPKDCFFVKASVISIKEESCAYCLAHTGQILIYSLPSLKILLNVDSELPVDRIGIWRTFCIANEGQGMYMGSRSEIQRISVLKNDDLNVPDSFGDLFVFIPLPERPSKGFFARLFTGQTTEANRAELFGSKAGSLSVAEKKFPRVDLSLADSPFSKAYHALKERESKVNELADKTEKMAMNAGNFASAASQLRRKYESKKWYEFW